MSSKMSTSSTASTSTPSISSKMPASSIVMSSISYISSKMPTSSITRASTSSSPRRNTTKGARKRAVKKGTFFHPRHRRYKKQKKLSKSPPPPVSSEMGAEVQLAEENMSEFVPEQILRERWVRKQKEYLIQWLDYPEDELTWELAKNLDGDRDFESLVAHWNSRKLSYYFYC